MKKEWPHLFWGEIKKTKKTACLPASSVFFKKWPEKQSFFLALGFSPTPAEAYPR